MCTFNILNFHSKVQNTLNNALLVYLNFNILRGIDLDKQSEGEGLHPQMAGAKPEIIQSSHF